MTRKLVLLTLSGVVLLALSGSALYAQEQKKEIKIEKKITTEPCGRAEPCDKCQAGLPCGHEAGMKPGGMMGQGMEMPMDMPDMMPDLPPDAQKKLLEHRIKSFKDVAALRDDIALKRMELQMLWMDENPNLDKLLAKMKEISQVEMSLKEKMLRNRFAAMNLVPEKYRDAFRMGGMGMGGMSGGCMGMCHGMGQGMGMGLGKMKVMKIERNIGTGSPGPMGGCGGCPGSRGE